MRLTGIHRVYFIGIGGIGMSALARYFLSQGIHVSGYDRNPSEITNALTELGADIHFEDSIHQIPADFLNTSKDELLVIYTPAIPKSHNEYSYFLANGYPMLKRAEVLGLISSQFTSIAVAGTHGKTTTSSMIGHILMSSYQPVAAFLGGITVNYQSNYFSAQHPSMVVLEADEYDRSFLQLSPNYAVITSMDPDHLDIYGNEDSVKESFHLFANRVNKNGLLFVKMGLDIDSDAPVITYGIDINADVYADNIQIVEGRFEYDVFYQNQSLGRFSLSMGGRHNIENSLAAIAVCHALKIDTESIRKGVFSFKGVKRRFEKVFESDKVVYVDDYAHHPEEIKACIQGIRELYPKKKILGIFQPHLYSRTRDFATGFASSLSMLDELLLMDIYPARELPIEGVTSDLIYKNVTTSKQLVSSSELLNKIEERLAEFQILLTIGAGDIDRFIHPIHQLLTRKFSLN